MKYCRNYRKNISSTANARLKIIKMFEKMIISNIKQVSFFVTDSGEIFF